MVEPNNEEKVKVTMKPEEAITDIYHNRPN
jgi:hypothetical protein